MKKIVWIVLAILCACGLGYIGYVIFQAKNIETVEISGNMQTLYVVGEDLNFGDAKLKVTYKNGNIRMVDMNEKTVDVSLFATATEDHKVMKITYKSQILEVPYDVIKKGFYYVENTFTTVGSGNSQADLSSPRTNWNESPNMIYIRGNGSLDYYYKDSGKWYMYDGYYDPSISYSITGDTMNVKIGDKTCSIKAKYTENGAMKLARIDLEKNISDPEVISKKVEYVYKNYETAKLSITSAVLDLSKTSTGKDKIVAFKVGETIKSSGKQIFLKVNYQNTFFLTEVYVHVCDEMVSGASGLDTTTVKSADYAHGVYNRYDFEIFYSVENA